MMMARLLPSLLFGPFAGVLVDRVDRKRLMITADISRGVMYGSMPFLKVLPAIFALSFLIECLSLVWGPAKDSSIPNIVPRRQLENANTIGLASTYGTLPLGGLIFSLLAGLSGWIGGHVPYFHGNHFFLPLWLYAAAVGIGMGIGMASLGQITKFIEREKLFPIAMLGAAGGLLVVAAMPNIVLAAIFTVVMGVFVGVTWVTGYALLQENVADEFRGR